IIEHDERQDHLLEWDLIHADSFVIEMRRRIDVSAVLPDHLIERGAETIVLDRIGFACFGIRSRRHFCLTETRPNWRVGPKAVSEIDELFGCNHTISAREIILRMGT